MQQPPSAFWHQFLASHSTQPPIATSMVAPLDLLQQAGIMVEVTLPLTAISTVVQLGLPQHHQTMEAEPQQLTATSTEVSLEQLQQIQTTVEVQPQPIETHMVAS